MIKETIFKADYQPVTIINDQRSKLMFKTQDVMNPVYKKDDNGQIIVDEQGNPIIDHYEDTDYCNVLVEYYRGQRTEAAMIKLVADWYDRFTPNYSHNSPRIELEHQKKTVQNSSLR